MFESSLGETEAGLSLSNLSPPLSSQFLCSVSLGRFVEFALSEFSQGSPSVPVSPNNVVIVFRFLQNIKMIDLIVVCVLCGCCSGLGFAFFSVTSLVCGFNPLSQWQPNSSRHHRVEEWRDVEREKGLKNVVL